MRVNGLELSIPDDVYQPAEDSVMLAEAARGLRGRVLEIGCGSGIASLSCAKGGAASVLGIDINPSAVRCSIANARRNSLGNASFIQSDLFSNIDGRFDAILFNPPYLPTAKSERIEGPLNLAFDGGEDGRKVLDRFLEEFDRYLEPSGTLLLIQSSLNNPGRTREILESLGFEVGVADRQDFFFESLMLFEVRRLD